MKTTITILQRALLLVAFCFSFNKLSAQYDCTVKHFTTNNGFPDNEVTTLAMDYDGYLWIGTYTSLVRYDGTNFKKFTFDKDKTSWTNIMMYAMPLPADKKLMIKTRGTNVYTIEKGKPVLYSDTGNYSGCCPLTFLNGNFPSAALFKKYYQSIFSYYNGGYADYLFILPLNNKDFIFGVRDGKFYYMRDGIKQAEIKNGIKIKLFLVSKNNRFLLDNENNMHIYDSAACQFQKVNIDWQAIQTKEEAITDARFFSDPYSGESFCFYNSIFYLLDYDARQNLVKFIPQFSINDKKHFWTWLVYDSLHSTFFLSTLNEGFFQIKLKKLHTYNINERLPKAVDPGVAIIYSVVKTSDTTAVIPTGLQFTTTTSGIEIKKLGNIFGAREAIGMLSDKSILSFGKTLYYYSPKDGYRTRYVFNDSFSPYTNSSIQLLYPEGDSVWVSADKELVCLTKKTMNVFFDKIKNDRDSNCCELHVFYRINKEEALVSSVHGLSRFRTVPPYKMERIPEMKNKFVHSISAYKDALILAVYGEGLYILKEDKFYKVPVPEDLEGLSLCHTTYIDAKGYLWITTDKGLFKSLASVVVESAINKGSTIPFFYYYGDEDGIENIQFTGGGIPPYAVLKDEQILFPSLGGMVSFKPGELNYKIISTPVLIDKITIDNSEIDEHTDSIRLHADFKYLVIDLAAPNFGDAKNLSIEYSLDNAAWKKITESDKLQITLVGISSGKHELVIRKRTGFGNEDFVYTKLAIYKEKAFYQQLWFYPTLLLFLVFGGWLYGRLRTQRLNRKRKELQRLVNEQTAELSKTVEVKELLMNIISHDMTSPLRHISLVSKALAKGIEKDPEQVNSALMEISATSDKILSGSIAIINWMKYNNKKIKVEKTIIELYDFVNNILEIYTPLAKSKNIILVNNIPQLTIVEADENILTTIITNLISNAVKYIDKGEVRISFEQAGSASNAVIKVSDNGLGIKEEMLHVIREVLKGNLNTVKSTSRVSSGLGYLMMSELVKIHGFSLTVDSEVGKGTVASLYL